MSDSRDTRAPDDKREMWGARPLANTIPRQLASLAVLFIDADVAGAEQLAHALRHTRAVAIAPSWQAAKLAIGERVPNLIVLDLDLPDAPGLDVIGWLHRTPALRHILLVVTTHRSRVQDKISAFQAGADDYLVKPVLPTQFAQHIERLSYFRQVLGDL